MKVALTLISLLFSVAACAQTSSPIPVDQVTPQERSAILQKYDYLDPENIVPTKALSDALVYFEKNKAMIHNQKYLSIIDFSENSARRRFFLLNLENGLVWNVHVAHGRGSDPDHDGNAQSFSNESGSNKSALGFYLTNETYYGDHGLSLRLDGLSTTNSNARERAIVIHGADYVQEADVVQGRSLGCPAVDMSIRDRVIAALKNGSLIYATK